MDLPAVIDAGCQPDTTAPVLAVMFSPKNNKNALLDADRRERLKNIATVLIFVTSVAGALTVLVVSAFAD